MPWQRPSQSRIWLAAALLTTGCLSWPVGGAAADAGSGTRGAAAPAENSSHVHDDDPRLRKRFDRAAENIGRGRWHDAVEQLQAVIDDRWEEASTGRAVSHVMSVSGTAVYEGAWLVARHELVRHGEPLRAAYAAMHGATARELFAKATAMLDENLLAEIARRFLVLPEGRAAALALADAAAERGDVDAALARLEALEDLEEVSDEPLEALKPWREARIAREARLLSRSPARAAAVREHLARVAAKGPREAVRVERVPWADRAPRPAIDTWPTTGGASDRAARSPSLGTLLVASVPVPLAVDEGAEDGDARATTSDGGTSPWLPPRAVVGKHAVFVSDGANVLVFERSTQRIVALAPLDAPEDVNATGAGDGRVLPGDDPHKMLPLLEGHALTLDERPDGTARLYVACCRRLVENRSGRERLPDSAVAAFSWNGAALERLWRAGGVGSDGALPPGLSLYGAPCLYRGLVWVAGARPTEATADRLEAWLVGLGEDGTPRRQVHLGSGSPVRGGRLDEGVPSSPAAARGRVVVSTSLGFVAAVDAEDGRLAWIYRYDRGVETGKTRRLGSDHVDEDPRLTGFANEPPVLAFELTLVAPTDSNFLYGLATRPRGPQRDLERWNHKDRRSVFGEIAVEYVAGVVGGSSDVAPQVIVVGKGDSGETGVPGKVIVGLDPLHGFKRWSFPTATGRGSVPYGRAVLTEREAFVPTRYGLMVVDLAGAIESAVTPGADRPSERPLLTAASPAAPGRFLAADLAYGNLVPLPGEGLLAVNSTHVTFWRKR